MVQLMVHGWVRDWERHLVHLMVQHSALKTVRTTEQTMGQTTAQTTVQLMVQRSAHLWGPPMVRQTASQMAQQSGMKKATPMEHLWE